MNALIELLPYVLCIFAAFIVGCGLGFFGAPQLSDKWLKTVGSPIALLLGTFLAWTTHAFDTEQLTSEQYIEWSIGAVAVFGALGGFLTTKYTRAFKARGEE